MHRFPLLTLLLILGACSSEAPYSNRQTIDTAGPSDAPTPVTTVDQPKIDPVPPDQLGQLSGELRCTFADPDGRILLAGSANVGRSEPVDALIGADGRVTVLQREVAGGFAALRRGGSFSGSGVRVTVTVGEAEPAGHEGSANRATLTLVPTGEPPRVAAGRWSCGP